MQKIFFYTLFVFAFTANIFSQNGTLRGVMYDDATGDPLPFGNVIIDKLGTGTTSDLDGAYSISLPVGTYNVTFNFLGYSDLIIENVEIKPDEVTLLNGRVGESMQNLDVVVITASQARNTEAAVATLQRKSINMLDGISAASFKKIGDSDAAAAVKRVPGVSVEGGKYIYVRGLGDRYTKTILNGMDIPGLDPDRNTVQMDIFPTNILDNIIVLKTFTPDLPADFTGGVVDITTKDFPERKTFSISGGLGYNPDMHLNSNYLTYEGGSTDFLGFDDGTRSLPTEGRSNIPFLADAVGDPRGDGQVFNQILQDFNPNLAAMRANSFMDYSLSLSSGNQFNREKVTLGYNLALTYKNNTDFYQDAEYNRYGLDESIDVFDMESREIQRGDFGVNNVLLGGLAGFSAKTKTSKIGLNVLHLQNGESKAGLFNYIGRDQGSNFTATQHNLEYSQSSLTNIMINGTHNAGEGAWKVDWKAAATRSQMDDPDIRFTRIRTDGDELTVGSESGIPERIWRFLSEDNLAGKADATNKFIFRGEEAKLKFGGGHTYKQRDYSIENFQIRPNSIDITDNPNDIFQFDNLWTPENRNGVTYDPQFLPNNTNAFDANINNTAAYASLEFSPINNLRSIIGVRAENYVQRYSGINQDKDRLDNEVVIDDLDFFPAVNLIYALREKMNLRLSYSMTIARPSFKEASFATILDPITGRTFIGGFFPDIDVATGEIIWDGNLRATNINNFDLRWELFQNAGQLISVSGFYKTFNNPIEIVQYVQAPNNFQPRNVGFGQVFGAEFELRKSLAFVANALDNITFNANITVTQSSIEMSDTEFNSRVRNARDGQEIDRQRDMAGQAPYLINTGLSYANPENGWGFGMYYNVQGETLQFVGIADRPDVYSVPFHSLNVSISRSFGTQNRFNVGAKVSNLLGDDREEVFKSFGTQDELFTRLRPERTFSLSFGYKM